MYRSGYSLFIKTSLSLQNQFQPLAALDSDENVLLFIAGHEAITMGKVKAMDDAKIEIYIHPNREIRSFMTPLDIFTPRVDHFKNPLDQASQETLKRLTILEARIVREIMAIPGVEEIYTKPKEIRLKKKPSSSWEDIQEKVITVLKRALRRKQIKVVRP